jgi:hypothetical protein
MQAIEANVLQQSALEEAKILEDPVGRTQRFEFERTYGSFWRVSEEGVCMKLNMVFDIMGALLKITGRLLVLEFVTALYQHTTRIFAFGLTSVDLPKVNLSVVASGHSSCMGGIPDLRLDTGLGWQGEGFLPIIIGRLDLMSKFLLFIPKPWRI